MNNSTEHCTWSCQHDGWQSRRAASPSVPSSVTQQTGSRWTDTR